MIRWHNLYRLVGYLLLFLSGGLASAVVLAWLGDDLGLAPLLQGLFITLLAGLLCTLVFKAPQVELSRREGILLVVVSWLAVCALGALPYLLSSHFQGLADAFFESVSGFTTTGSTILSDIEALPPSLLYWRSLTQWLGGMGIILLGVAILPLVGAGGMELYRAEFSGARSERITPRIAETARALWKIYVAFTIATYVSLRLAGLSAFDAICHAFTSVATGGFSTRNTSIEAFANPTAELIIIFFMFLAAINFTCHYRAFVERRPGSITGDPEVRFFALIIGLATLALAISESRATHTPITESALKSGFQVVSIVTSTGYSSADYGQWTPFGQLVLLALMFCGGCTGSTAGGMKVARVAMLLRVVGREFRRITERRGVFAIRLGGQVVGEPAVQSVLNLVYLALVINFASSILLTSVGIDILTSISAVATAMFNIGPGLGSVGPAQNFGHLPELAKWVLSFCMLAGRLEFYTLLVIFTSAFWKK